MMRTIKFKKKGICGGILFSIAFSVMANNGANVNFKGNLILNPPCDFTSTTGADTINVDFKDILIRKMETKAANVNATTAMYQTRLPLKLDCGDTANGTALRVRIQGTTSVFNTEFLGTDNDDVGIQFINLGRGTFIPNNSTNRRARILVGDTISFYVVPIRNAGASVIKTGPFNATATLIAEYE
ncbi:MULTISPECIES: fimbrial protein [Providencia]|uniref:Fimbrial-type adhesion domain-containing protein n=2 Tax=Providencia TaxID=586 RepID=A0A264VNU9_PRORE|nr:MULTISPECIES: fimbrial protein [Providencia]EMA4784642.1 fimbrial protein [Providencia rettgeri]MBG5929719.1 fimbrial protein [Providencia rettgeri]MBN6367403.1 fimbrial protein [Providencia rettgeri]MDU7496017.1 fimbrial protein [Providencia rettgeri]OZS73036.1 hypothetical protein CHI95_18755 [Providencia rettgeri]